MLAQDGGTPLGNRFVRHHRAVHRNIHQGAGLSFRAGLLNQNNFAGERRRIRVPRPFHGCPTHRFREHVIAKGLQVTTGKRFQIDDGGIERPFTFGTDGVTEKAFFADAIDVLRFQLRRYDQRKTNALNTGIVFFQS